jgi:catechol 2,3-dioxygenase-like lactoylglutathione lyase family enzyme
MASTSNHHLAIRVDDVEKAADFYATAFGANRMMQSFVVEGDLGEMVAVGPKGTSMTILPIEFPDGGAMELFNFSEPAHPTKPIDAWQGTLMHFAIQVEDTDAALEQAEAAGGKRIWPEVLEMGPLRIVYIHDLDGNVIEIIDGTMADVITLTKEAFFGEKAE